MKASDCSEPFFFLALGMLACLHREFRMALYERALTDSMSHAGNPMHLHQAGSNDTRIKNARTKMVAKLGSRITESTLDTGTCSHVASLPTL